MPLLEQQGKCTLELRVNPEKYPHEPGDLSPEGVCLMYSQELINIVGSENVSASGDVLFASFQGSAHYLPHHDPEGAFDGEGDTLRVITDGKTHDVLCYRFGLQSVRINGDERRDIAA